MHLVNAFSEEGLTICNFCLPYYRKSPPQLKKGLQDSKQKAVKRQNRSLEGTQKWDSDNIYHAIFVFMTKPQSLQNLFFSVMVLEGNLLVVTIIYCQNIKVEFVLCHKILLGKTLDHYFSGTKGCTCISL